MHDDKNVPVEMPDMNFDADHPGELAHYLETLPVHERQRVWEALTAESRGEILPYLHETVMQSLLEDMQVHEIAKAAESMEAGDIADVVDLLPEDVAQEVIDSLSEDDKAQVTKSLQYPEDSAGRLLDYEVFMAFSKRTVGEILGKIRERKLPAYTDMIIIVGRRRQYIGAVALSTVLESEEHEIVGELSLIESLDIVDPKMPLRDLAALFRQKHYVSLPVVNEDNRLLGRITLDDAIDVLQDEADHQLMGMAGLDEEEDLFAPVLPSAKRRAVWLGINLLTALLASWVIGWFEGTLEKVVALAVLMPIVASMGGIAGSQTLTLVIRGLALKQISEDNRRALFTKELGVAWVNGVLWAASVGLIVYLWFADIVLAVVIAIAILINALAAACAGLAVPLVLHRFRIDPALSGSVVLTTITDVIGFLSFLGIGTLCLL